MTNLLKLNSPIHGEISSQKWDHVVVSVSGGKDSGALLAWAVENFPKEKLIAVHAIIDIDWHETMDIVKAHADHFGVELVCVQAVDKNGEKKGFIDQLLSPRVNRKTGVVGEYQFPGPAQRWCTSILKTGPIDKYCRALKGNILVLIGERREESSNRAKLSAVRPDSKNSKAGRSIVKYSPILDLLEKDVWKLTAELSIPKHPCYDLGISRASCAICIFSSKKEIAIAAIHAPDIVQKYMDAEAKIQHSFRYKKATKKTPEQKLSIKDILAEQGISLAEEES